MPSRPLLLLICILVIGAAPASAGVVVISNRTAGPLRITATGSDGEQTLALDPADLTSLRSESPVVVRWRVGDQSGERELAVDAAYFFYRDPRSDALRLGPIGPAADPEPPDEVETPAGQTARPGLDSRPRTRGMATFTVKLLADEEERASRKLWEARLRNRLKVASAVFEHYCRVRFETIAVETWKSNDAINEFEDALADFRDGVGRGPARLAIGFTSQYEVPEGRTHLGGTYGPLATHILLREWSQHLSEAERTELLVHELGHFLGAAHSLEADSVMRPLLGDKQAAAKKFRIRFDPLNTLAICLVAEECRDGKISGFRDLSLPARGRLIDIYRTLAELLPEDPAAPLYYSLASGHQLPGFRLTDGAQSPDQNPLEPDRPGFDAEGGDAGPDRRRGAVGKPAPTSLGRPGTAIVGRAGTAAERGPAPPLIADGDLPALVEATRSVLAAIVAAGEENQRLPRGRQAGGEDLFRRAGDGLTEYYVRAAAAAALVEVPQQQREKAFLLGLAIGLESSSWLREVPVLGGYLRQIEPDASRRRRLASLGEPTMRGRNDLVQHFLISAALTALAGARSAETAGVGKELRDADGGSGFSFCDLCADLAGIEFAQGVQSGALPISRLARGFRVSDYLPDLAGFVDDLSHRAFVEQFGSTSDRRFHAMRAKIRERISTLPAYGGASVGGF